VGAAVAVFMVEGLHVPAMLLFDVAGSIGAVEFWHTDAICVKVGIMAVLMVMSIVAVVAHCPALGVKLYVAIPVPDVFIVAGLHVPLMLLFDVVGSTGTVAFWHNDTICVKVGVTAVRIVMSIVAVVAHCPAVGVKE